MDEAHLAFILGSWESRFLLRDCSYRLKECQYHCLYRMYTKRSNDGVALLILVAVEKNIISSDGQSSLVRAAAVTPQSSAS